MARGFGAVEGSGASDAVRTVSYVAIDNLNLLTISIWALRTGAGGGGNGRLFAKGEYRAFFDPTGADFYVFTAGRWATSGSWRWPRPDADEWHNTIFTYNYGSVDNDPIMYTDGELVGLDSETTTPVAPRSDLVPGDTTRFTVGNQPNAVARVWDGHLAEAVIWDAIVNANEARAIFRAGPLHVLPQSRQLYLPIWGLHSPEINLVLGRTSGVVTGTAFQNHPPASLYTPKWAATNPLAIPDIPVPVNGAGLPPYGQVIFNSADEENRPRYGQRIARGTEE